MFWELSLISTTFSFVWGWYRSWRSYRRTFVAQPEATKALQSSEDYQKAQSYTRTYSLCDLYTAPLLFMISFSILYFQIKPIILKWVLSFGFNFPISYFLFLEIVGWIVMILSLPIELYAQFGIEGHYGFNTQTLGSFFMDKFKGYLFSLVFNAILTGPEYWLLSYVNEYTWLYLWIGSIGIIVIIKMISPRFIEPFFIKLTPLEEGSLKTRLEELASKVGFSNQRIYVIDSSKRTTHSNAYVQGLFGDNKIVLGDTLLKDPMTEDEIVAIVAHELGHWHHNHVLFSMIESLLDLGFLFYMGSYIMFNFNIAVDYGYPADSNIMLVFGLALNFLDEADFFIDPINKYVSRYRETQADIFAAKLGYSRDLSSGLIHLTGKNLGNLNPDPLSTFFGASHPTIMDRLEVLQKFN